MPISYIPINPIQLPQFPQQPNVGEQILRLSQLWQEAEQQRIAREQQRQELEAGRNMPAMIEKMLGVPTTPPIVAPGNATPTIESTAPGMAATSAAAGVPLPSLAGMAGGVQIPASPPPPAITTPSTTFTPEEGRRIRMMLPFLKMTPVKERGKAALAMMKEIVDDRRSGGPSGNIWNNLAFIAGLDAAGQEAMLKDFTPEQRKSIVQAANLAVGQKSFDAQQKARDLRSQVVAYKGLLASPALTAEQRAVIQAKLNEAEVQLSAAEAEKMAPVERRITASSEAQKRLFEHQDEMQARSLAAAEVRAQSAATQQAAVAARTNDNQLRSLANQRINANTANPLAKKIMDKQDRLSTLDTDIQLAKEAAEGGAKDVSLTHLTVLYDFVSQLDNSVVRESEMKTFASARLGYLAYLSRLKERVAKGEIFSPSDFKTLLERTRRLQSMVRGRAEDLANEMVAESARLGIPGDLAVETVPWTMLGVKRPAAVHLGGGLSPKTPMGLVPPPDMPALPPPTPTVGAKGGIQTQGLYTDGSRTSVPITASDSIPAGDNADIEEWLKGMGE